jgi:uncharacterized protein YidB (DUF937 family)
MALEDILTGMMNGPRGQRQPTASTGGGGMSKTMMALLGLLAYKAFKGSGQQAAPPTDIARPTAVPSSEGLGDVFGGLFGGNKTHSLTKDPAIGNSPSGSNMEMIRGGLGGAAAGGVLSKGLGNIIAEFQKSGHGQVAQSWVGSGPNQEISSHDLANSIGNDTLDTLSQKTGISRDELLNALKQHLPELVDKLTPHGRLPTDEEAARII